MSDEAAVAENRAPESGGVEHVKQVVEAALLAAGEPLSRNALVELFAEDDGVDAALVDEAVAALHADCEHRGVELAEVASGYRLQTKTAVQPWISRMWQEKPQRFSRALLETLALIAYRQPITRGEIEDIRGVSVSSSIMRTLQERGWVKAVGHRDVPGRPAVYATTKTFLDYFNLKSLDDLPTLAEIRDIDNLEPELPFDERTQAQAGDTASQGDHGDNDDARATAETGDEGLSEAPQTQSDSRAGASADTEDAVDVADEPPEQADAGGADESGADNETGEDEAELESRMPPQPGADIDDPWDVPSTPVGAADNEAADTADGEAEDRARVVDDRGPTEDAATTQSDANEHGDGE